MGSFPVTCVLLVPRVARKHGSPCYRRFDDFQGACARGGGGSI